MYSDHHDPSHSSFPVIEGREKTSINLFPFASTFITHVAVLTGGQRVFSGRARCWFGPGRADPPPPDVTPPLFRNFRRIGALGALGAKRRAFEKRATARRHTTRKGIISKPTDGSVTARCLRGGLGLTTRITDSDS